MNKRFRTALLVGAAALPAGAWAVGAAGTVAAPYLELPMGARGTGMAEAFSGISDDVNALYYNPAGLTAMDSAQLELMHIEGFGGINYENLGLAVPAEQVGLDIWGTVGLSYTLVQVADTPRTQAVPGTGGNVYDQGYADLGFMYTAGDSVIALSYAWQATKLYSVGATLKAINEKVDTVDGWGMALDIGLLSRPEALRGISAGMTLTNLGVSPDHGAALPSDVRVGFGYDWKNPFTGKGLADRLLIDLDAIAPIVPVDGPWRTALGFEYTRWFKEDYFGVLRTGYQATEGVTEMNGVAVGCGLGTHWNGIDVGIDYAWVPYGILGNMNRVAIQAAFGTKERPKPTNDIHGLYLYPPANVAVSSGDRQARVSWEPQKGRVDGYNLYMSYNPASGKWTRLNKAPITSPSQTINGLYNGYKVFFAVSTLAKKEGNLYQESDKSPSVVAMPQGGAAPRLPTKKVGAPPPLP
jgi:hypothetical protein